MSEFTGDVLYKLSGVQKAYNGRVVLDVDHLQVRRGEILGLVGPSGAGKSTLLRLLAFLERPTVGRLDYQNRPCDETWPDLDTRRRVTMVFQNPHLLRRSVIDNVAYGLNIRGRENGREDVTQILRRLGLQNLAEAKAHTLSGGEAQRVALARALVLQPDILLLDEPTSNLDPYNIKLIEEIVRRTNDEDGTTVVIVTHNVFQARRLAHRAGLLLSGELVEVAETESFFTQPQDPNTAAFVRGDMIY
ncbi:MAG: phosphate ABC transporter ATP-binding protein [Anaerolineaceae bacterium]|nr:MAG: phosphate ABC transporter ATP-binding protein [Anaerolineaceae bacterium]